MKKLVLILLGLFIFTGVYSQNKPKRQNQRKIPKLTKQDVAAFMNRTNEIIKEAADVVKEHEVYTGALVKAKEFQKKAKEDFDNGNIKTALNNSSVARDFCVYAYTKNTGNQPPKNWKPGQKYAAAINVRFSKSKIEEELSKMQNKDKEKDAIENLDDLPVVPTNQTDENSKGKTR